MQSIELKAGDIVAGLEPDEHVEIRTVKPFGSKTLIEGHRCHFTPRNQTPARLG
jgi:hypothetical protein